MNDLPEGKENADAQQCEHCQFTEDYKILSFGHTKCVHHRPCTGAKYWEPDNCSQCLDMIAKIETETDATRHKILNQVSTFLDLAKQKIEHRDPHRLWDYKFIDEYTFRRLNVSQPPQGNSLSGAVSYKMVDVACGVTYPEARHTRSEEITDEEYKRRHGPSPPRNIATLYYLKLLIIPKLQSHKGPNTGKGSQITM